ncbi:plasmid pRiA4b ORF-3 family protein [Mesonia sp. HuA40]|uniref:IS1096 element passenger TnpR family protein n=1 Tax=Mesonia sp. HuA40 TaxID=2602761 RepID=UPI0011C7FBD0|nr:plasmid pRiA4b ORF-3 family protein [Mesonia sp. HuA40]TXK74291.1 plasmid pRiA4b ORF-3 family protein [Mesonia sp. HuA40]
MVYKFRIVLDTFDDVFRDLEIKASDNLEDLHNTIVQAFGFDGSEMASFYLSDEDWTQGEEIVLFDMSEGTNEVRMMNETRLDSILSQKQTKLIYVYDFFSMWTFYVELADITQEDEEIDYPNLLFAQGQLPDSPPEKQFEADPDPNQKEEDADLFDEFDDFDNLDNLDDIDYNQYWN